MGRKRWLILLVLFVFAGLLVYTFADYSENEDPADNGKENASQPTQKLSSARDAVELAEETILQGDVNTARELVAELEDGTEKTELANRLTVVQDLIDANSITGSLTANTTDPTDSVLVTATVNAERKELIDVVTYGRDSTCPNSNGTNATLNDNNQFTFTVTTNGTYTMCITTTNGVTKSARIRITNIGNQVAEVDTTAPVITLKGNSVVAILVDDVYNDQGATAIDNIDGNISDKIVTNTNLNVNVANVYTISYNVKDEAGNDAITVTRTVHVLEPDADYDDDGFTNKEEMENASNPLNADSFPVLTTPIITIIGDNPITIERLSTYNDEGATAKDSLGKDLTVTIKSNNVNENISGTYEIVYETVDRKNNTATATRTVTVEDTTAPTVISLTYSPDSITKSNVTATLIFSEEVKHEGDLLSWTKISDTEYQKEYTTNTTETVNFKDLADNDGSSVDVVINWIDKIAPTITITSPTKGSVLGGTITVSGTATDNLAGIEKVTVHLRGLNNNGNLGGFLTTDEISVTNGQWSVEIDTTLFPDGEYGITVLGTDKAGNSNGGGVSLKSFTIDNNKPTITLASHSNVVNDGAIINPKGNLVVTITDNNLDKFILNDVEYNQYKEFSIFEISWALIEGQNTFKAIDKAGNVSEIITIIVDTKNPTFHPEYWRKTVEADKNATFTCPTATGKDENGGAVVTLLGTNVNMGVPGEYKCQYVTEDKAGNKGYNDIFITVEDTTRPTFHPEYWRKTVEADKNATFTCPTAYGTDNAVGNVTVTLLRDNVNMGVPGEYKCQYVTEDATGLKAYNDVFITVEDTTKPTFHPEYWRKTVEADKNATFTCPTAYGTDNAAGDVTVTLLRDNVNMGVPGEYKCQYVTEDASGLKAYNDIFITVEDTTKPTFHPEYWRKTVEADKTATFTCPTAYGTDNAAGDVTATLWNSTVNMGVPGEYKCQYVTEDATGLKAYNDVFITVEDTTKPTFHPEYWKKTVEVDRTPGATFTCPTAYGTDNAVGDVTVTLWNSTVNIGVPGSYKCQYVTTDAIGLKANNDIFITVVDTTAPTATITYSPADFTTGPVTATITFNEPIKDGSVKTDGYHGLGDAYAPYFIKVDDQTYTFKQWNNVNFTVDFEDLYGNAGSEALAINKIDKVAPTITEVTSTPETTTNGSVTIAVTAVDQAGVRGLPSGLHSEAYSFDNGSTWQASNEFIVSSNTTLQIKVRDALGNISAAREVIINNIEIPPFTTNLEIKEDKMLGQRAVITGSENITIADATWNCSANVCSKTYLETVTNDVITVNGSSGRTSTENVNITSVLETTYKAAGTYVDLGQFQWFGVKFNRNIIFTTGDEFRVSYEYKTDEGDVWTPSPIRYRAYGSLSTLNHDYVSTKLMTNTFSIGPGQKLNNNTFSTSNPRTLAIGTEFQRNETSVNTRLETIYNAIKATGPDDVVYVKTIITIVEDGLEKKFEMPAVKYWDFKDKTYGKTSSTPVNPF